MTSTRVINFEVFFPVTSSKELNILTEYLNVTRNMIWLSHVTWKHIPITLNHGGMCLDLCNHQRTPFDDLEWPWKVFMHNITFETIFASQGWRSTVFLYSQNTEKQRGLSLLACKDAMNIAEQNSITYYIHVQIYITGYASGSIWSTHQHL
jgi:hypothetical protein